MSERPVLDLEAFIPYRLTKLADVVSQSLSHIYSRQFGLSIAEWRVIATLGQSGTMTAKDIGAHSHMHKTKVSRAVNALADRGLLLRQTNRDDMREAFLALSDSGRKVYEDLVPDALTFADDLTEGFSQRDTELLNTFLDRLTKRATALAKNGRNGPSNGST